MSELDTSPRAVREWLAAVGTVAEAEGNDNVATLARVAERLIRNADAQERAVNAALHAYGRVDPGSLPLTLRAALDRLNNTWEVDPWH